MIPPRNSARINAMRRLARALQRLFNPPPVTPPPRAPRVCPVAGCTTALYGSHTLCGHHWQLLPAPLAKALQRARHQGADSPAYRAARATAIAAVERLLKPPPTNP
ncbi:MAG: hypothetical protein KGL39_32810 [Patescibacteria group bacterium]|nr:hypothetical protein [Patescibacteria group bacterium]